MTQQHDFAVSQTQYDRLVQDFDALDAKLADVLPAIREMCRTEDGAAKVRAMVKNRPKLAWLRLWVSRTRKWQRWLDAVIDGTG